MDGVHGLLPVLGVKVRLRYSVFFISRLALPLFRTPDKRLQEGLELPDQSQYKKIRKKRVKVGEEKNIGCLRLCM